MMVCLTIDDAECKEEKAKISDLEDELELFRSGDNEAEELYGEGFGKGYKG